MCYKIRLNFNGFNSTVVVLLFVFVFSKATDLREKTVVYFNPRFLCEYKIVYGKNGETIHITSCSL